MPNIRSSADLRNKYSEISSFCHDYAEPVFITKNGKGDLAVMSIEVYEQMMGRFDLYHQLMEGMQDVKEGNTRSLLRRWQTSAPGGSGRNDLFLSTSPQRPSGTWPMPQTILTRY